jgi:hypothetical protein
MTMYRKKAATEQVLAPTVVIVEKKGQRRCSICNQKGHNSRGCNKNK